MTMVLLHSGILVKQVAAGLQAAAGSACNVSETELKVWHPSLYIISVLDCFLVTQAIHFHHRSARYGALVRHVSCLLPLNVNPVANLLDASDVVLPCLHSST